MQIKGCCDVFMAAGFVVQLGIW